MKRIIYIILGICFLGVIIFALFKNKRTLNEQEQIIDRSSIPVSVKVFLADSVEINSEFTLPATLIANEEAVISAATSGNVKFLNFELGTNVKKGQKIGQIDIEQKQLELQSLKLTIKKLERDYNRNQALLKGDAISETEVIDSKYELDAKKLEAAQLEEQITDASIETPLTGIITEKNKVKGEYVTTGTQIAKVVDSNKLKAQIYVPESKVFSLQESLEVKLTTSVFPTMEFNGIITYISPKADENYNYVVEITLDNNQEKKLKAGMYVRVTFNQNNRVKSLLIPKKCLIEGILNPHVFIAENDKANDTKLTLGEEYGENIEVVSGLNIGDKVITTGQINLINGSNIKIIKD